MTRRLDLEKARLFQQKLESRIRQEDALRGPPETVCGLDVAYYKQVAIGAAVLLRFPSLELIDKKVVKCKLSVPYIPTFLSFREYPPLSLAYSSLEFEPDVCFVDAHGRSHPRKLGAASHFGVLRNVPTIGVAKRLLCGTIQPRQHQWSPIHFAGEIVGAELTTKPTANPIYVSVGHRITLKTAIQLTQLCTTKYRLPEPTRHAHRLASETRQKLKNNASGSVI